MKTKVLLSILLVAGAVFTSCKKDEDPTPLTKDEAVVEIASLKTTYSTENNAMETNEGKKVFNNLSNMDLPFVMPDADQPIRSKINSFHPRMEMAKKGNVRAMQQSLVTRSEFVFSQYVGTWEWNKQTQEWNHTSTPTDKVVVKFAYPSTNATNNAAYTISKYTLASGLDGVSGDYNANITVDGSIVWSIALSGSYAQSTSSITAISNQTITYTSIAIPKVSYEFKESTELKMSGNETAGNVSIKASSSIKKNGETLFSSDFTVTGKSSGTSGEMNLNGNLRIANVRFEFLVAYKGSVDTSMDMNQYVTMNVYNASGSKIGYMKYETVNNITVLWFYYNNGDKVNAEEIFGEVFNEFSYVVDLLDF